jgi:hypothetical protein
MNGSVGSHPTLRRYSKEMKERAVRMVLALRAETGAEQGCITRVADHSGEACPEVRWQPSA